MTAIDFSSVRHYYTFTNIGFNSHLFAKLLAAFNHDCNEVNQWCLIHIIYSDIALHHRQIRNIIWKIYATVPMIINVNQKEGGGLLRTMPWRCRWLRCLVWIVFKNSNSDLSYFKTICNPFDNGKSVPFPLFHSVSLLYPFAPVRLPVPLPRPSQKTP